MSVTFRPTPPKTPPPIIIAVTVEDAEKIKGIVKDRAELLQMSTFQYSRSLPAKTLMDKSSQVCTYVCAGAGIGATTGALLGVGTGPLAPIGVPVAAAVGGGIGAGVGGIVGVAIVYSKTQKEFKGWQKKQNAKILSEFREAFKEHPALEVCLDEVHFVPMTMPTHCACPDIQHTFDYPTLEAHVEKYKNCPISRRPLTKEDLRIDYRRMGEISAAYKNLLIAGAKVGKFTPPLMIGVRALSTDLEAHKTRVFKAEQNDIVSKLNETTDGTKIVMLTKRLATIAQLLHPSPTVGPNGATSSGVKS